MGEGKLTPLTTPTPLNRQSRNIAHVITSTISLHTPHMVKVAPGDTSPHIAKVTTHFFFLLCTQKLSTDLELSGRWTDFDMRYINRRVPYSRRVVPFACCRVFIPINCRYFSDESYSPVLRYLRCVCIVFLSFDAISLCVMYDNPVSVCAWQFTVSKS